MLPDLDRTELSQIIKACPIGVALTDDKQKITWVNESFQTFLGITADEISGKSIDQLPESLKPLFLTTSTVHLVANSIRDEQWFMCSQSCINGSGHVIHYITDVGPLHFLLQDREVLKRQLKDALATDEVTGMPNKMALFQSLESQISRSRRYNNLLSIVIMRVNHLADLMETQANSVLLCISQMLNDQVRWADIVGRLNDNEFLLVLPETFEEAAKNLCENLNERMNALVLPDGLPADFKLNANFGYAEWAKGDDLSLFMQKTQKKLGS
jgi:diguanylate cyclase (GGDEF)-like protein/PAS domain S-box-containing protein